MFIEILKYGFLVIFFSTAIIGIASIPGWIKIPEWYRKRIFVVLVLEVIGVIIIYSKQEFASSDATGIPQIILEDTNWIALSDEGKIISPEIIIKTRDTTIRKKLGKQSRTILSGLSPKIVENGLNIVNTDSVNLGYIKAVDLERSGLFNSFNTAKNEITSSENYSYVKWSKSDGNTWKKRGSFIEPLQLDIQDDETGTYYTIRNKRNENLFDSRKIGKDLFSMDNRIIHFFENEGAFYLLRIARADLNAERKFIDVINVKMKPTFK
jgi:hypothetical protein